jgi:hypothetical protein
MAKISILEGERTQNLDYAVLLVELSTKFNMNELNSLAHLVLDFIAQNPQLEGKDLYEIVTFSLEPDANMSGLTSMQTATRKREGAVNDYLGSFEVIYTIVPKAMLAQFGYNVLRMLAEIGEDRAKQVKVESQVEALVDIQKRRSDATQK